MTGELKREGAAAIATDDSAFTVYMNQRRAMQQKQSSDQLMMAEINNMKIQISELSLQVQELTRLITNNG